MGEVAGDDLEPVGDAGQLALGEDHEVALVDPILVVRGGQGVLSMRTSTTNMNGTDATRRVDIADVDLRGATPDGKTGATVTFRPGISPQVLALLSTGPASPLDLRLKG